MTYIIKRLRRFCGFFTGFVFFFSGILKVIDPTGAGLVVKEYLDFMHLDFLEWAAKPAGTFLALAECAIGTALITGVWRKATGITALSFQGFFTLLTLCLVIFNPEMDCGCFGEAIHLTHMETFIKNIILCGILIAGFIPMRGLGRPKRRKYASFGIVTLSVLVLAIVSWRGIPMMDFTEFKPGTALQAGNAFHTADEDIYEAVFIYEKDGTQKAFGLEDLPDSTWTFVSTRTVLKEEFEDGIASLSFADAEGNYMDNLACTGKVMVISVHDTGIPQARMSKIMEFAAKTKEAGFRTLLLYAGADSPALPSNASAISTYRADYKTLITLNRSNGGATFISDGYIIRKWARGKLPDETTLHDLFCGDDTEAIIDNTTAGNLAFQGFLLYVFAVMLLM